MQTDGYTLSLTSERNKNINFSIVAKHSAARLGCLADTHRRGTKKYLPPVPLLFIICQAPTMCRALFRAGGGGKCFKHAAPEVSEAENTTRSRTAVQRRRKRAFWGRANPPATGTSRAGCGTTPGSYGEKQAPKGEP